MGKSGQKIDELYISLGLDLNQLNLDLVAADKSISQNMSKLNSDKTQLRLKLDVDLAGLDKADKSLEAFKLRQESLLKQIEVQRQKVELAKTAKLDNVQFLGEDSPAARKSATNLLREQKIFADMQAELNKISVSQIQENLSRNLANIDRKKMNLQLKTDIDVSSMGTAAKASEILFVKEKSLNQQLDLQRQKYDLLKAAHAESIRSKGEESAASEKVKTELLREAKALKDLETELHKVSQARKESEKATNTGNKAVVASEKINTAVSTVQSAASGGMGIMAAGAIARLGPVGLGAAAIGASAYGIAEAAKSAMNAGEAIWKLQQKMHLTSAEAANMGKIFKLGGVDLESIIPTFVRLDKQLLTAGAGGNETTKTLEKFSVSLKDSAGNILPMNEQLAALAEGYSNAAKAGMEEEFVAGVLGARGLELVPILENYTKLQERSSQIKSTGLLSPQDAHELSEKWKMMNHQMSQLGMTASAALLPVALQMIPQITSGLTSLVSTINENKDSVKSLAGAFGDLISMAGSGLSKIGSLLNTIGLNSKDLSENIKSMRWLSDKHPGGAALGLVPLIGPAINKALYSKEYEAWKEEQAAAAEEANRLADEKAAADKKREQEEAERINAEQKARMSAAKNAEYDSAIESAQFSLSHSPIETEFHEQEKRIRKEEEEAVTKSGVDRVKAEELADLKILEARKKMAEQLEAINKEVSNSLFNLTHSDLENSVHAAEEQAAAWKKSGADAGLVDAQASAAKAKIYEDFEKNVASKIDSVWKSSLQNRLDDIDREKKAWEKKGVDEVKATQWAEHEKRKAQQAEALSALKENRKYLDIIKSAMAGEVSTVSSTTAGGTKFYDVYQDKGGALAAAKRQVLELMRKENGIRDDDIITPDLLSTYSSVMKYAQDNLVPGLEMDPKMAAARNAIQTINTSIHFDTSELTTEMEALPDQFAALGESSSEKFFAPFQDKLSTLMGNSLPAVTGGGSGGDTFQTISPNIHVEINSPQVRDTGDIAALADKVADVIQPAIARALGDDSNSY